MSPTVRSRSNQGIGRIPHLWNADLCDVQHRSRQRHVLGERGGEHVCTVVEHMFDHGVDIKNLRKAALKRFGRRSPGDRSLESSETPWRAHPDAENGRRATKFEKFLRVRLKTADPRYIRP